MSDFFIGLPKRLILATYRRIMSYFLIWKAVIKFHYRGRSKPHGLASPLIVSLTSYPARFETLPLTLKCLLSQSMAADRVVLWIAYQDKSKLTPEILSMQQGGLEIAYCEDLRSYKKIIPALHKYPESFIVTADDDLYYWSTWLEELVQNYRIDIKEVVCHRAHRIQIGADNLPLPYSQWEHETNRLDISFLNFPTSGAGVLYPPNIFLKDVLHAYVFQKICPNADDVWLYWMIRMNNVSVRVTPYKRRVLFSWPGTQCSALYHHNVDGGGNDEQINAMVKYYGFPK